jgi:hypothetical protein
VTDGISSLVWWEFGRRRTTWLDSTFWVNGRPIAFFGQLAITFSGREVSLASSSQRSSINRCTSNDSNDSHRPLLRRQPSKHWTTDINYYLTVPFYILSESSWNSVYNICRMFHH